MSGEGKGCEHHDHLTASRFDYVGWRHDTYVCCRCGRKREERREPMATKYWTNRKPDTCGPHYPRPPEPFLSRGNGI